MSELSEGDRETLVFCNGRNFENLADDFIDMVREEIDHVLKEKPLTQEQITASVSESMKRVEGILVNLYFQLHKKLTTDRELHS